MIFGELAALPPIRIWDGIVARAVEGERVTFSVVELDPGSVVAEHAHEHEQIGIMLAGSMTFRAGGEEREVAPGSTWSIPANVPHEVRVGPDGAVVAEVFAPRRADWDAAARDEPRAPRWPRVVGSR